MKKKFYIVILIAVVILSGCGQKESFNMQGKVRGIGDAMEHCRAYMSYLFPDSTFVSIDSESSREVVGYYDIFLVLDRNVQEGFAQCRVNKSGLITYHSVRQFYHK